ncbi:HNH endonuclease [Micromonospora sp. CA-248212]|uniref:HNH endonuclease n=1 Tax=Micromonospora sp. CA-248212 TaxID=3239961 RepID=UPI003D918C35
MERRTPIARMSQKRRQELAEQGNTNPFSTLSAGAPLNRAAGGRMASLDRKPAKPSRKRPAVPPAVRDSLIERAAGWCEIQRLGCFGQGTDPSHRVSQKSGGRHGEAKTRHDRLSNLMWACRRCHDFVTNNPEASKAPSVGWALEEWQRPAECPALYRGRLVLLADDGSMTFCSPNHDHATTEVSA